MKPAWLDLVPKFFSGLSVQCLVIAWLVTLAASGCEDRRPTEDSMGEAEATRTAPGTDEVTASAFLAFRAGDLETAERLLKKALIDSPSDVRALELLGDVALQRGDVATGLQMYRDAIEASDVPSLTFLNKVIAQCFRMQRPYDAIETLHRTIKLYPQELQPRFDLAGITASVGLPRQSLESLRWLGQRGQPMEEALLVLADPDQVEPDVELLKKMLSHASPDRRIEHGLALFAAFETRWQDAKQSLESLLADDPDFIPAYILYGRALIELNATEELKRWEQTAPDGVADEPDYWLVVGLWAQKQGQHARAIRSFEKVLAKDDTTRPRTLAALIESLNQIGRSEQAQVVAEQLVKLGAMRDALKTHLERDEKSQLAALEVASSMMTLGRIWEAEAWARTALKLPLERVPDARERYLAIRSQLSVDSPWQLPDHSILRLVDFRDIPREDESLPLPATAAESETPLPAGTIRLADEAKSRGLVHTCRISAEAEADGHWIHHSVGGGAAVIDYDLDGWPDLALAMLDGTALQSDSSPNRLFRNLTGRFTEVTAANYDDRGFSHGITVGDFNEDGFADIYDANLGQNRLYRNNGDGTFQEVALTCGLQDQSWTASAAMVDIDGDSIADLFDANYCAGKEPFERKCTSPNGKIGSCAPLNFAAQPDRVWRGVGDGTFEPMTDRWLRGAAPGRALGVVAGQFDERPGIDLYVANDMTANHLWSSSGSGGDFKLDEIGIVRGVAFNAQSLSQASMGIAAGDADGDGDTDFFVTHFFDDHNTLYEQTGPGFWSDRSVVTGIAELSMKLLGFGAQFADLDNNGAPELLVTNGHISELGRPGVPYRMRPQLLQRDAKGRWNELPSPDVGAYFEGEYLGRALLTLDADRDGLTDSLITHLYDPVALLMNRSPDAGSSICFELKATLASRDAIGAIVSMNVRSEDGGSRIVRQQLTAGDGYMCTNERCVVIGTGRCTEVTDVTITWPSGKVESLGDLATQRRYLVIEGTAEAFVIPGPG
jgi:tetratricopeptide (TPR) repeat protein